MESSGGQPVLRWFDPRTEREVAWVPLSLVPLARLQQIFGVSTDDPMYGYFPVTGAQLPELQRLTDHRIRLSQFDYFVEFDAVEIHSNSLASAHA